MIYGQRVLLDGTVQNPSVNQRVSLDSPLHLPSYDQESPAIAYHPDTGNALVVWQDARYDPDRGPWGIWGRFWVAVDRIYLPLVLRAAP